MVKCHPENYYIASSCNPSNYCKKLPEAILVASLAVGWIAALKVSVFVIIDVVSLSLIEVKPGDVEMFSSIVVVVNVVNILVSGVPT